MSEPYSKDRGGADKVARDVLSRTPLSSYIMGVRDLAAMPHVSLPLGDVYRDCAAHIEALEAENARLQSLMRANLNTMEETAKRCRRWGKATSELQTAIDETRAALSPVLIEDGGDEAGNAGSAISGVIGIRYNGGDGDHPFVKVSFNTTQDAENFHRFVVAESDAP